ncbi:tyrosine-type recombinase/integrase [Paradevosia shaoguanensis]|uniref:tyrosine-type recombinase/integrase n=1 Tax=Paradevosia shaoguanensis TaxID=1335043 RepID=UPI0019326C0A|nr:site-specific integrase [Paradevosia shaoguanensis]
MPLVKRGNSKFWYVQFQLNGRHFIKSTRTTDRKIAERIEAQLRADVYAEVVLGKKKPMTLEATLQRFLDSKTGTANHRNLVSRRKTILRILKGSMLASMLTSDDLEHYRTTRAKAGIAAQTIKHELNFIIGAMNAARKAGFEIPEIHAPTVKVSSGRTRYLTSAEEARLLAALDPTRVGNGLAPVELREPRKQQEMQDNYDLVVLLLDTGARYSEIADISWERIDLPNRMIKLWRSKVQNESVLFMTDRVFEVLSRRWANKTSEHVFTNKNGGPRGYRVIALRKAFDRAGLTDCSMHTLRHTHASRLVQLGMSVYEVRAILGHSDIRTTMRYAHLEQTSVSSRARDLINRLNSQAGEVI